MLEVIKIIENLTETEKRFFWRKVDKTETCWNWNRRLDPKGYGRVKIKGRKFRAHRLSYQIIHGPIKNDLYVLHKCHNRKCVNPDHLYLGTQKDNLNDAYERGSLVKKLDENRVREIFKLREKGYTQQEIANIFNIHQVTVSMILLRKRYKEVDLDS